MERRRRALDMTREDLAGLVNCSVSALRKIEDDERKPSKELAERLARALGIVEEEVEVFVRLARGSFVEGRRISSPALPGLDLLAAVRGPADNLPDPLTVLIGREKELSQLGEMLVDSRRRLITLFGPGGVGKTHLAIEAARSRSEAFPDGIFFIALAPLDSPEFVVPAIAEALELVLSGSAEPERQLLARLRDKRVLLLLDNAEHLLGGSELFQRLLEGAPGLTILLTSREQTCLRGEWAFEVRGLELPDSETREGFGENVAVRLFVEGARRASGAFEMKDEDLPLVVGICRLAGGLPLAIELASSWARTLSCREIAREMEADLAFLIAPPRSRPERHRSLKAVFDSSWKLLSFEEREILARLSVFRGGFTREAAAEVAAAPLDRLASLVIKSLVVRRADERYDMHETLRQYAVLQLNAMGAGEATRDAHLLAFARLARSLEPRLCEGDPEPHLARLDLERDNFRAALQWGFDSGQTELCLRICLSLWRYWQLRSLLREGSGWLERSLRVRGSASVAELRSKVLVKAGFFAYIQNRFDQAKAWLEECLSMRTGLCEREIADAHLMLALVVQEQGEYQRARELYDEAGRRFRDLDDKHSIFCVRNGEGWLAFATGDLAKAEGTFAECEDQARARADKYDLATSLANRGWVAALRGDRAALGYCREALDLVRQLGNPYAVANCLEGVGAGFGLEGRHEDAVKLFGAADALRETLGAPPNATDARHLAAMLRPAKEGLSESGFAEAWLRGRGLAMNEAIRLAEEA
jgi:predicted ATPase/DNA-binding XRE family transcriptional regulator